MPLWREAHLEAKIAKAPQVSERFWKFSGWKRCVRLWREAHWEITMIKASHCRSIFGSWHVEKVHAIVARSTFRRNNGQNTSVSERFWKFSGWKVHTVVGARHMFKWKCYSLTPFGPVLEVEMFKKCKPLRRGAHFEVKMLKAPHVRTRTTFGRLSIVLYGRRNGFCILEPLLDV